MRTLLSIMAVGVALLGPLRAGQAKPGADQAVASKDVAAVKATFEAYREAVLADRGKDAASLVSKPTVEYFETVRKNALSLPAEKTKALDLFDRLMIVRIRHELKAASLKGIDGRGMIALAIDKGWVGKQSVKSTELAKIDVQGDKAAASVAKMPDGPKPFAFVREGGEWKFDLAASFELARAAMGKIFEREGMTENEVLFQVLEQISGRKPTEAVWQPLAK